MNLLRTVKKEIRILGLDCAKVPRAKGHVAQIVGVIYRGRRWLDGVVTVDVETDKVDATEKIARMILTSVHYGQLRIVMLSDIALAGRNLVDIKELCERTHLPAMVVKEQAPTLKEMRKMREKFRHCNVRKRALENAGAILPIKRRSGRTLYVQFQGLSRSDVEKALDVSCSGRIPEPLRVARLIASALERI